MWWIKDNNRTWHYRCLRRGIYKYHYQAGYFACENGLIPHEITETKYDIKDIVETYFADRPHKICEDCWRVFEQSNDYATPYITQFRNAQIEREKAEAERQEKARIREEKIASGRTEVVIGKIVVIKDVNTEEEFAYYIAASSLSR